MKLKKILSSARVFVMLFTSIVAVIPVSSLAQDAPAVTVSVATGDDVITDLDAVKAICNDYLKYGFGEFDFETAEDMLEYEIGKGYIDSIEAGNYSLYVNRYTGFVYYKNNVTGQILTSNPIDPAYKTQNENNIISFGSTNLATLSQMEIEYFQVTNVSNKGTYNSLDWIMRGSLLEVSSIENGISVRYTLGEATAGFVAPRAILETSFRENVTAPAFIKFAELLETYCGAFDANFATANNISINDAQTSSKVVLDSYNLEEVSSIYTNAGVYKFSTVKSAINKLVDYAKIKLYDTNRAAYNTVKAYADNLLQIFTSYSVVIPSNIKSQGDETWKNWTAKYAALSEDKNVVYLSDTNISALRVLDAAMKAAVPTYTVSMVSVHEDECGYSSDSEIPPSFRCSIEYTIADDGTLIVEIPEESFSYDDSVFHIKNVSPLKYFGAGDMYEDGYIFFPDGSGTVVEFDDFFFGEDGSKINPSMNIIGKVYGSDYCYNKITGAHREQITVPVYGLVTEVSASKTTVNKGYAAAGDTVKNGYFTIIEDGASLSNLAFASTPATHKYAYAYSSFTPYLSDEVDLSQSLSVSNLGSYVMVAKGNYTGSYKAKITMLTDDSVAEKAAITSYYPTSYVGMAFYYRDYLKANGTLTELTDVYADLPLYIEALGSIDITKKILSFPVTVSTPLTTFEDVEKMYGELSTAVKQLQDKAAYYAGLANDTPDDEETLKKSYQSKADKYTELAAKVQDIKNINFRLTGFANGGMYFTYPAKVKWESSVGGKRGFKTLLEKSSEVNAANDGVTNFSVYPDFDFMYINNTSSFDGVSKGRNAATMVDNRYASKQVYDSISQEYETLFVLLISTDSLDKLYTKFEKKYSKFDISNISVSTLGSDLNSNFDEKNVIDRETAMGHVTSLLNRMASEDSYSLMTDAGNAYAIKYMDHILNISTDSSHFRYSSYAVPFLGMVLHGYVNYAGTPLNYSGSPDYDILRAIENGASLYYILCCENTNYLKEDLELSKYYGIDYENWFDKIVEQYATLNSAIGDLQKYNIVNHEALIAERVIDDDEMNKNYSTLAKEYIKEVDSCLSKKIDLAVKALRDNGLSGGIKLTVDRASLMATLSDIFDIEDVTASTDVNMASFVAEVDAIIAKYNKYYNKDDGTVVHFGASDVSYESLYSYITDSVADSDNYDKTDFTCDNNTVVRVTYYNAQTNDTVIFILNYNTFAVDVRLADGADPITLDAYGYVRIDV